VGTEQSMEAAEKNSSTKHIQPIIRSCKSFFSFKNVSCKGMI